MQKRKMSLEQKKKRAKIAWVTFFAMVILLKLLQFNLVQKFRMDPLIYFLETGNILQRFIAIFIVFILFAIAWFMFYTLLSIMLDTKWRKLGMFLLGITTIIYVGMSVVMLCHYVLLLF